MKTPCAQEGRVVAGGVPVAVRAAVIDPHLAELPVGAGAAHDQPWDQRVHRGRQMEQVEPDRRWSGGGGAGNRRGRKPVSLQRCRARAARRRAGLFSLSVARTIACKRSSPV